MLARDGGRAASIGNAVSSCCSRQTYQRCTVQSAREGKGWWSRIPWDNLHDIDYSSKSATSSSTSYFLPTTHCLHSYQQCLHPIPEIVSISPYCHPMPADNATEHYNTYHYIPFSLSPDSTKCLCNAYCSFLMLFTDRQTDGRTSQPAGGGIKHCILDITVRDKND